MKCDEMAHRVDHSYCANERNNKTKRLITMERETITSMSKEIT